MGKESARKKLLGRKGRKEEGERGLKKGGKIRKRKIH